MSQQINLFNPVFMQQRKYFSAFAMLQALGLIVLGSGLFYGYAVYQIKSLTEQIDETSKRYSADQNKANRYSGEVSALDSGQSLDAELKSIKSRLAAQNEHIATLKGRNVTGYSEYLRAFARQTVNGLWLKSININEDATQINITGSVLSPELLPAYILRLNQEPVMRGKSFASLQMQRDGSGARSVEFTLVGEAAK